MDPITYIFSSSLSFLFTFPQNPNPSPPQPIPLLSPPSDLVGASLPCPPRRWRIWSLAVTGLALDGGSGLGLSSSRVPPPPHLRLPREGRRWLELCESGLTGSGCGRRLRRVGAWRDGNESRQRCGKGRQIQWRCLVEARRVGARLQRVATTAWPSSPNPVAVAHRGAAAASRDDGVSAWPSSLDPVATTRQGTAQGWTWQWLHRWRRGRRRPALLACAGESLPSSPSYSPPLSLSPASSHAQATHFLTFSDDTDKKRAWKPHENIVPTHFSLSRKQLIYVVGRGWITHLCLVNSLTKFLGSVIICMYYHCLSQSLHLPFSFSERTDHCSTFTLTKTRPVWSDGIFWLN